MDGWLGTAAETWRSQERGWPSTRTVLWLVLHMLNLLVVSFGKVMMLLARELKSIVWREQFPEVWR